MKFLSIWVLLILIASLGFLFPYQGSLAWSRGSILAGADNLLLPLAIMLIVWSMIPLMAVPFALRSVASAVVWLSAANAAVAIISTIIPLGEYLRPFWNSADVEVTVAENAEVMGRYSGIFGQPAEAGLMYSIAGLLAITIYRGKKSLRTYLVLSLLMVGGALSVSKVFILVGAPLILWSLWRSRKALGKAGMISMIGILSGAIWATGFLQSWDGFEYLLRLFETPDGQSSIEFYTAGRWNEGSAMSEIIDTVMRISPIVGFGAQGLVVPYDSAWAEIMVMAGVIGAALLAVVFLLILGLHRKIKDEVTRRFAWHLALVVAAASTGIPSLTANRAGTVVWILVALLTLVPLAENRKKKDEKLTSGVDPSVPGSTPEFR